MSLICNVVGARPNFMKMAPVILEQRSRGLNQITVHTGQHFDPVMSDVFFAHLKIPEPNFHLGVGSGTHAEQTARIMERFEKICIEQKPALVVVAGDVNSTLACALVAAKLSIPVAHVEAGLRSFDRSMAEEVNRVLTDHLSSLLFTTEVSGNKNLIREGICKDQIYFVGNPMIDSLRSHLIDALAQCPWKRFLVEPGGYGLVTLHRPSNVDKPDSLSEIITALRELSKEIPLLFTIHPRTRQSIEKFGIDINSITITEPLGYKEFLGLMAKASVVLTDSGGIQEETTALGVPCITLRNNTERPITIELGTNRLAGVNRVGIISAARMALATKRTQSSLPPLWDGHAANRIIDVITEFLREQPRIVFSENESTTLTKFSSREHKDG
jgi:UDP-N-acetylglucosamine 2-epimerase (non-hydrolysing)